MIGASQILKLHAAGKPLHCVTWDFGPERPVAHNGQTVMMGGKQTNHFATKAQADKELAGPMAQGMTAKPVYSTRPVTAEEAAQARAEFFYILT